MDHDVVMYTEFFGLAESPFHITPDPRYLWYSDQHREVKAKILHHIQSRKGPVYLFADVGTGTGFVSQGLALQTSKVIGFDASPEMIAVAQRNLAPFDNVELHEAVGDQLPVADEMFDGVFANMYLHHAPDPLAAIQEMARVLKRDGVLCITDLDTHDHEWQREQMADVWLGFDRQQIRDWFVQAGFEQLDIDCAEGTCNACGPDGEVKPLSIFVATGEKAMPNPA